MQGLTFHLTQRARRKGKSIFVIDSQYIDHTKHYNNEIQYILTLKCLNTQRRYKKRWCCWSATAYSSSQSPLISQLTSSV